MIAQVDPERKSTRVVVGVKSSDLKRSEAMPPDKTLLFPNNAQFWYETRRAFGSADYGASEFGEVLATAGRIQAGDSDSWLDAWNGIAERLANEAKGQLTRGHKISARDGFLRASTYYRSSEFLLHGNPQDPRISVAYRKSVECYCACAVLFDAPIEPVEIPYEQTTLPGYFHRVDRSDRLRPLIILHTGFDGSAEEMHVEGACGAIERGYNVLAFDGPGQFGPLHRECLDFRPDWENVITPVVDFALKLPGVDPKKIALMGFSMGGYLAPRAAAYERRIAALIANDGVWLQVPKTGETIHHFIDAVEAMPGLSKVAAQVVVLVTGAHFNAAYELYAHGTVATQAGLSDVQIAALSTGEIPADLDAESTLAAQVAGRLLKGGVLPGPQ